MSFFRNGKFKIDTYYEIKDNAHQTIYSYQTPDTKTPIGDISFAFGTDYRLDEGADFERTVLDCYTKTPITDHISFKGRIRSNYSNDKSTTQFRGGLELSHNFSDGTKIYTEFYAAEKVSYNGGNSDFSVGAFGGISRNITDNTKVYIEGQCYDLENPRKDTLGVNIGFSYQF